MANATANRRQVVAICIGNALEWYDFSVYGYLAVTISRLFFPPGAGSTALLSTLAIFGVAFAVRPLGGIVLGHYADLVGRKSILFAVIALMTLGIGMIAVAPTYATVGVAAPLTILVARLIQGLSAGGEFGSSMSFLVELAPPGRRGLYGGWQQSGQGAATLLAGLVGSAVARGLTPEQLDSWGWRLPFLAGLIIGPIGVYMRLRLAESPEFLRHREHARGRPGLPIKTVFTQHGSRVLVGLGLVLGGAAAVYVLFLFMPTYAIRVLKLDLQASFVAPVIAGLMLTVFCPIAGYLSDLWGRKAVMATSAGLFLVAIYPAFIWLNDAPSVLRLGLVEFVFGLLMAGYSGPFGAALADMFGVGVRVTGMSIVYNVGIALFGGFAPLIVAWLIASTGNQLAPAYYVMAGLLLSFIAALVMPVKGVKGGD